MVGQNIGKYRVLDRIGRGGMGTVYRAIDETLHREVAIKVLNAELDDPEVAKRFRSEAITVARLSHPGIATIYELFQHEGQWLMVMEFVRGETLEGMVARMGALSPQRTAELCMQTLAALAHAHSMGVVHRDLKPANIMITETGAIKVMDFGIARVAGTEHLTSAGFMMGTPAYMAPEQVMGKEIDARADLYAMGVVFYRLTTGKLPFKGDTPFAMAQSQVNDPPTPVGVFRGDLPPWVEQIVVRALAKSPDERFQSAIEFHEGFARCLSGLPMATPYSSSAPTELMMTPPRAMPTGSLPRSVTSSIPPLTGSSTGATPSPQPAPDLEPTVLSPTPMAVRMPTGQSPVAALEERVLAPPYATPAATPAPTPTASVPASPIAPPATSNTGVSHIDKTIEETVDIKAVKPKSSVGMIAAVAVVLLAVGTAAMWYSSRRAVVPPPAATESAVTPATEAAAPTEAAPAPPPAPTAPAPPPGPSTPPASSAVSALPPAPAGGRAAAGAGRSTATPAAAPPAAAARAKPVEEAPQRFSDIKVLIVKGRKADDEDVTLNFADGHVSVLAKKDGTPIGAIPYTATVHATYARARDPKWDAAVFGPPQNLDVGGMLRTSKHWLVLQAKDAYLILRLDDSNWRDVLDTVASRTNLVVDRPASNDKP